MATTVFRNGSLFDGRRYRGRMGAVVVRDGLIADVLRPDDECDEARADAGDEVVDLEGGLLAPGFVDVHVHTVQGGLERMRCDLSELHTRAEYLSAIGDYAAAHPDADWILGGGWAQPAFPGGTPLAADLDQVVADRPVFLPNRDHHGAWVNGRAFEIAAVTADTPDPPDGRIERDADGRPSGTLHEGAMAAVSEHLPDVTETEYDQALQAGQTFLHSVGVVGWQDAIIGSYAGMDDAGPTYRRAAERGQLSADVVGALWWDRDHGPEQVADLRRRRAEYSHGRFRATSVKIMQDGVPENGTAALGAPYLDRDRQPTPNQGHSFVDPFELKIAIASLAAEGFQVHVHAIGDRAVTETLDAFDYAHVQRNGGPDLRHHIAHLQMVKPSDVPRFAELGVAANLQALWACRDDQMVDLVLPFVDDERAGWQYPFRALEVAGSLLAMGSDWPVTSPDPLAAIHVAVNRTLFADPGRAGVEPLLPEQAIGLETAFAAYTSGSAFLNHRDASGVIAPGRVADLVILDRDPFAGPADEIGATRVSSTWIDGEAVFTR